MEKQTAKATAKGGAKIKTFDMNAGLVAPTAPKPSAGSKASKPTAAPTGADADTEHDPFAEAFGGPGELDQDIALIRRKTLAVRADNMNELFAENIGAITDSVQTFQQMEEQTVMNDPVQLYMKAKEGYDAEIEKL